MFIVCIQVIVDLLVIFSALRFLWVESWASVAQVSIMDVVLSAAFVTEVIARMYARGWEEYWRMGFNR